MAGESGEERYSFKCNRIIPAISKGWGHKGMKVVFHVLYVCFVFCMQRNLQFHNNKLFKQLQKKCAFVLWLVVVVMFSLFHCLSVSVIIELWYQRKICRSAWLPNPKWRATSMISLRTLQLFVQYSTWVRISRVHLYVLRRPVHRFCIVSSFRGHQNCGRHLRNFLWHLCRLVRLGLLHHRDAKKKYEREYNM